jgi:hypothetical protein
MFLAIEPTFMLLITQAERILGGDYISYPRSSAQSRGKLLFFHQRVSVLLSVFISGKVLGCGGVFSEKPVESSL